MARGRKWHDAELVGLIAWIDICKKSNLNFDDTVVDHLRNVTEEHVGDDHEFSINAIKTKLIRFPGPNSDQLRLNQIIAEGSSCFPSFVAEHHQAFREAVRCYGTASRQIGSGKHSERAGVFKLSESMPAIESRRTGATSEQRKEVSYSYFVCLRERIDKMIA